MVLSMYELSHPGPPNVVLLVTRLSWLLLGTSGIRLWELLLKKSKVKKDRHYSPLRSALFTTLPHTPLLVPCAVQIITGSARWDEMRHRLLAGTQDRDGDVQVRGMPLAVLAWPPPWTHRTRLCLSTYTVCVGQGGRAGGTLREGREAEWHGPPGLQECRVSRHGPPRHVHRQPRPLEVPGGRAAGVDGK